MKFKFYLIAIIISIIVVNNSSAYAIPYDVPVNTPCEILSELTGKSIDEIRNECYSDNKTFLEIAEENNVLESFKKELNNSAYDNRCNWGRGARHGCKHGCRPSFHYSPQEH